MEDHTLVSSKEKTFSTLLSDVTRIVGEQFILTDQDNRSLYSADLSYRSAELVAAVVQPGSVAELASVVRVCTEAGLAVVPRGGGMSYTGGYTPEHPHCVCVDTSRLNHIREINVNDRYVVVEAGCTWKSLNEALKPLGVRTPFWGPFSGKFATIGGALSQNAVSYGSGLYGTAADSVLGLQVVLADGSLITTGSGAHESALPFFRHFGPDITGLFTSDAGAFGIKAVVVLKLIEAPREYQCLSYAFDNLKDALAAQADIARLQVASDCYCFDPFNNADFERKGVTFEESLSLAAKVARRNGIQGVKELAKIALSGKNVLRGVRYSLHLTLPGLTRTVVDEHAALVNALCLDHGGLSITNTIPVAHQSSAFENIRLVMMGPTGDIWLPTHGIFPSSKLYEVVSAFDRLVEKERPSLDQHGIRTAWTIVTTGQEFLFEPFLYWHDELGDLRLSHIEPEFADEWRSLNREPQRRGYALEFRNQIRDLLDQCGGLHLQLGRFYPYLSVTRDRGLNNRILEIKQVLDPKGLMNPGVLGL